MMRTFVGLYSFFFSILAFAQDQNKQPPAETVANIPNTLSHPVNSSSILELTLGLIFIVILIFIIAWFVKRFSIFHPIAHDQLKVVAGVHLGQREKILLLKVGEEQILVGLTATDIRTLHKLDKPLDIQEHKSMGNSDFARKLASLIDKTKGKQ
jgi:flagellar protein FliO/FliZ